MIFEVSEEQINSLSDTQLTEVLRLLLILEAKNHNLPLSDISVSLNIKAPDGGLDGCISWQNGPTSTQFLFSRDIGFQCKAMNISPTECADELLAKNGAIKPLVNELLKRGGDYVLFTTQSLNKKQSNARIVAMRKKLCSLRKGYGNNARVNVFGADAIRGWVNCHLPAIVYVQSVAGFAVVPGLKTWQEWDSITDKVAPYFADTKIQTIIGTIQSTLSQPGQALRVVGLSGLGKTRLALEAFRPKTETDSFASSVVYFDAAQNPMFLRGEISEWRRSGCHATIVVDNCPPELHLHLQSEISVPNCAISVLTLDLNPDERLRDVKYYLRLEPSQDDHVLNIVKQSLPGVDDNHAKKIVNLSGGFVSYALLLCEAWSKQDSIEDALPDARALVRLLWGGSMQGAQSAMLAIEACSLFVSVDIGSGKSDEAKYVATIANVDVNILNRSLKQFQRRGLVEQYGSYIRVRPHVLALRLCVQWWRECSEALASEIFDDVPESMLEPLCERMRMLNFLPEARQLTEQLCGAQGPFGQAEVLTGARGARIFRALVEINPEAAAKAMVSVISKYDVDELRSFENVRRDWVWALEKLVFHQSTYRQSAEILMRLADAEIENYSNNATGIFLQTFHVQLPGTEATLQERGEFLVAIFETHDTGIMQLALKAAGAALAGEYFTRTIGAEEQGSGPALAEYQPKTAKEIWNYWQLIVDSIIRAVEEKRLASTDALNVFAAHLRGFVRAGQTDLVDYIISKTKNWHSTIWEAGLDALGEILRFEAKNWPPNQAKKLESWILELSPDKSDISSRLILAVNRPSWLEFSDEDATGVEVNRAEASAKLVAEECSLNFTVWASHLHLLFQGEQRAGFAFGARLGELLTDPEQFISIALDALRKANKRSGNPIVLSGFLKSISSKYPDAVDRASKIFLSDLQLHRYAVHVIANLQPTLSTVLALTELVRSGALPSSELRMFAYGRSLHHLLPEDLSVLASQIDKLDDQSPWIALELVYMYCFGESKERWSKVQSCIRSLHMNGRLRLENHPGQYDIHIWKETAIKLLKDQDKELAIELSKQLILASSDGAQSFDLPEDVATLLLDRYGKHVWPLFANAFSNKGGVVGWRLTQYLGRGFRGSSDQSGGPIESLDSQILTSWLARNPGSAATVAGMIRPLVPEAGSYKWSPLAQHLLDTYGHNREVLSALGANLQSGVWWGPRSPFYSKLKDLAEKLTTHKHTTVRAWAKKLSHAMDHSIGFEERENNAQQVGRW